MPFDGARWQIEIAAADKSAAAFASVERRMKSLEVKQAGLSASMSAGGQAAALAARGVGGLVGMVGRLVPVLGAAGAAWAVWNAGMQAGALIDQAEQLGVAMESLQAYRAVAMQTGVTTEQFDGALQRLTSTVGAANGGSDEAIRTFDRLGVKLLDSEKRLRPIDDLLPEIARGLLGVDNATERAALAQEIFGRSGQRLLTMLPQLAGGADALTDAARRQGLLVEREAAAAWNKLDSQLKITAATANTALAALGAPIATEALEAVNRILTSILANLDRLRREAATAPQAREQRAAENDVRHLEERLAALRANPTQFGFKASEAALLKQIEAAQQAGRLARQATMEAEEDAAREHKLPASAPPTVGAGQATGKTAGAAGQKLDERLRELQTERAALETALAAFDRRGGESVEAIDRRLDAQVKLDKRIFDALKDVPPNSALAAQLTQEATAIAALNQRLDERKKLLAIDQAAEEFIRQQQIERDTLYMGKEAALAYRLEQEAINKVKAEGIALTPELAGHLRELARTQAAAAEETRRAREAAEFEKETFKELFSDTIRGAREGKDVLDAFGDAGLNALNKIADKLMDMALDDLWNAAFPGGGGGLFKGIGGSMEGMFDWLMPADFFPTFAEGGRPPVGTPYIVGEREPEVRIDHQPGTILNQRQLRRMMGGGGGDSVSVHMPVSMSFGSDVSRAELADWGARITREIPAMAVAAILDAKAGRSSVRKALKK